MKSPAFQLYAAEFLSDENVVLMDNRQLGCYLRLLLFCWIEGSIPNNIDKIARLCLEKKEDMIELWEGIKLCFTTCKNFPDRLTQKRLDQERIKQEKFRIERSESGKKGVKSREIKKMQNKLSLSSASTSGKLLYEANGSSSSPSSSSSSKRKKNAKKEIHDDVQAELPDFLNPQDWSSFLEHRKSLRSPMSLMAQKRAFTILEKLRHEGHDLGEVISQSIVNGWKGLFPLTKQDRKYINGRNNAFYEAFGEDFKKLDEGKEIFYDGDPDHKPV